MSKFRLIASMMIPAIALALAVGCGDKTPPKSKTDTSSDGEGAGKKSSKVKEELASTGWGTLKGKVTFVGDAPTPPDLKEAIDKQGDKTHCLMGDTHGQEWKIGEGKGIANVVVWLRAPDGKFFKIPDDQKEVKEAVKIDQPFCAFEPHVVAVYPSYFDAKSKKQKETGQKLVVHNSAPISHNTNWTPTDILVNEGGNVLLAPKKEQQIKVTPVKSDKDSGGEQLIHLKCDVHTWMKGHIRVFDHPFFAITKGDKKEDAKESGTYSIKNVPTGVPLKLVYWHESMEKPVEVEVTLKEGENEKNFEIKK